MTTLIILIILLPLLRDVVATISRVSTWPENEGLYTGYFIISTLVKIAVAISWLTETDSIKALLLVYLFLSFLMELLQRFIISIKLNSADLCIGRAGKISRAEWVVIVFWTVFYLVSFIIVSLSNF